MSEAARKKVEMRCRTCAYDLRGLTERRCPECGRMFDPMRPITVLTQPVSGAALLVAAVVSLMLVGWPLLAVTFLAAWPIPDVLVPLGSFSIILGGWLGGVIAARCVRVIRDREPWISRPWAVAPAMFIGGGVFIVFFLATIGSLLFDYFF